MGKYDVDGLIEEMLKHADKYPELEDYARGLRYWADREDYKSPNTRLTKHETKPNIEAKQPEVPIQTDPVKSAMGA